MVFAFPHAFKIICLMAKNEPTHILSDTLLMTIKKLPLYMWVTVRSFLFTACFKNCKLNPFEQILSIEAALFPLAFAEMEAYLHSVLNLNQSYSWVKPWKNIFWVTKFTLTFWCSWEGVYYRVTGDLADNLSIQYGAGRRIHFSAGIVSLEKDSRVWDRKKQRQREKQFFSPQRF